MSLFGKLFGRGPTKRTHIVDPEFLARYLRNPEFPWLISFPRTGSHWLRMIMELYFGKPSLRRIFFYHDATDFTCYHWHDVDLTTHDVRSVIYLYRHPVATIYSQVRYHKEDLRDPERIRHWTDVYARHLSKWIFNETFTTRKTIVCYEGLRANPVAEFAKVTEHFGAPIDSSRLADAMARVSKDKLKELTQDDQQVVNLSPEYEAQKAAFHAQFANSIIEHMSTIDSRLSALWPKESVAK